MQGKVRWFNARKGYGFIEGAAGSRDIFIHYSAIVGQPLGEKSFHEGDLIEFDTEDTAKGTRALRAVRVEQANERA